MAPKDSLLTQFILPDPEQRAAAAPLIERLLPAGTDTSELIIAVARRQFSASSIARAVEDCDAHLLNLNVLADDNGDDCLVALRIDHRSPSAAARSLERYGMHVMAVTPGNDDDDVRTDALDDVTRRRVEGLMRYLNV